MAVLVYLHIPKTAGMTLRQVIYRQYMGLPTYTFSEHHRQEIAAFLSMTQAERDAFRSILGHVHYGIHDYLSQPATYITLLRDPVERIVSSYYQVSRNPQHPRYHHYKEMSLLDYARKSTRGERQTRWIVGFRPGSHGGVYSDTDPLPPDALAIAKRHLDQVAVVGLVEAFDETLLLLRKHFQWRNIYYASRNVNRTRPQLYDIPAETLETIRKHAEPDLSLYAYAKARFQRQINAYGDTFTQDLHWFRQHNRYYGRMLRFTEPLRTGSLYRRARLFIKRSLS